VQQLGGSTVRNTAKLANGNIPYHRHRAQFMNGDWTGAREFFSFSLKSVSLNPLWCRSSNFSRNSVSFRNFTKFQNSRFPGSAIAAQDLAMNQSSAGEKNCIVYSLVFIFIVIIISNSCISSITMSMSISISFVALLNCLYLNP